MNAIAKSVATSCPYCGVGCGVLAQPSLDAATDGVANAGWQAMGDGTHPANQGRLCVKGATLGKTLGARQRLLNPKIAGQDVSWEQAITHVADAFREVIAQHGPNAVAFYVSGQLLTEDYYVVNKFCKGFLGTANIDTNSRLCMATAVAAQMRAFGEDLVAGCYEDLELADLLVLVGSNMAWTHPVVYQRIKAAKAVRPAMKVVLIDPRRTATAEIADLVLQIKPGTDGLLFQGLLACLAVQQCLDEDFIAAHTTDFQAALACAQASFSGLPALAASCEIPLADLQQFFSWFVAQPRTVTLYSQGINQSEQGVAQAGAIINCHLATGRIGKPGACPFSITGQPNAMGGREVGGLANQLAVHLALENAAERAAVAEFWRAPQMAQRPGLKAVDLFQAVARGDIKAIWIMATNPLVSLPDANAVRSALASCPLVVVSEIYADTDTLRHAHVQLPALGWSEKDGTVTNSERCISRQRAFLPAPGLAKPDWWMVAAVAKAMGFVDAFAYGSSAEIFREHAALSALAVSFGRQFDISALAQVSNDDYENLAPVQWPLHKRGGGTEILGTARLFTKGRFSHGDGRARFSTLPVADPDYQCSDPQTYLLNTGRIRDQWHTMTRTGRTADLLQHHGEPYVALHPEDWQRLGANAQDLLLVENDLGRVLAKPLVTSDQRPGELFIPIHWNDCFTGAGRVDALVPPRSDPISGQPAFKQTAVSVRPWPVRWQALVISVAPLAPPAADDIYWCQVPAGSIQRLRLAGCNPAAPDAMAKQWAPNGMAVTTELVDPGAGHYRWLWCAQGRPLCLVALWQLPDSGIELQLDEDWLLAVFQQQGLDATGEPVAGLQLISGQHPDVADLSPLVCVCNQVRLGRIQAAIAAGACTLPKLQANTQAGTSCGSCVPELSALLQVPLHANQAAH